MKFREYFLKKLKLDFEEKKRKLRKEDPLSEEEKNEMSIQGLSNIYF